MDITSFQFLPDSPEKAELVLQTILGENDGRNKRIAPSLVLHTLPTIHSSEVTGIPAHEAPGAIPLSGEDDGNFISVVDFTTAFPAESQVRHTLPKKPSIPFLVLFRPRATRKRWDFPTFEMAADFTNEAICSMYKDDVPYADAFDRFGRWGLFSTILLKTDSVPALEGFRSHLSHWSFKGHDFDTFPRDVATQKPDISILLRNNMKSFVHELIPKILFCRNADRLAGSLRVLSTRFFPEGETSHKGESKEHWRQIDLKGDEQVLRCLRFIPESSPFKLGVEMVQIRGGLRPQDKPDPPLLGKRTWTATTSPAPPHILVPQPTRNVEVAAPKGAPNKRGRGGKRSTPRS